MINRFTISYNGYDFKTANQIPLDFSAGNFTENGQFFIVPNSVLRNDIVLNFKAKEDIDIIRKHIAVFGIFQGMPITVYDKDTNLFVFNEGEAYLDLTQATFTDYEYTINVKIKIITFIDLCRTYTPQLAYERNILSTNEVQRVLYCVNSSRDEFIKLFLLVYVVIQTTLEIAKVIRDLTLSTVNFGAFAVAQIIYIALLIVQLALMIESAEQNIIIKARYYNGMKVYNALVKFFDFLGYKFKSTLFDSNFKKLIEIPTKDFRGSNVGKPMPFDNGMPERSFLAIMEDLARYFNGRFKINNNEIIFERVDYFINNPNGLTLTLSKDDNNFERFTRYNANELTANILTRFQRDDIDINTRTDTKNNIAQSYISSNKLLDKRANSLIGIQEIDMQVARVFRVKKNTPVNEVLKALAKLFNRLKKKVPTNYSNPFDLIGVMQLQDDAISISRWAIVNDDGRINQLNDSLLNASQMLSNYHISDAINNQQIIYEKDIKIPLKLGELLELINNPITRVKTYDKTSNPQVRVALIEQCNYDNETDLYILKVRVFETYDNTLTREIL